VEKEEVHITDTHQIMGMEQMEDQVVAPQDIQQVALDPEDHQPFSKDIEEEHQVVDLITQVGAEELVLLEQMVLQMDLMEVMEYKFSK
jgi:hypothetical protein